MRSLVCSVFVCLPPLVFRAVGAHFRLLATGGSAQMRGFATGVGSKADIGGPV